MRIHQKNKEEFKKAVRDAAKVPNKDAASTSKNTSNTTTTTASQQQTSEGTVA